VKRKEEDPPPLGPLEYKAKLKEVCSKFVMGLSRRYPGVDFMVVAEWQVAGGRSDGILAASDTHCIHSMAEGLEQAATMARIAADQSAPCLAEDPARRPPPS
jgi:hypothetical protein